MTKLEEFQTIIKDLEAQGIKEKHVTAAQLNMFLWPRNYNRLTFVAGVMLHGHALFGDRLLDYIAGESIPKSDHEMMLFRTISCLVDAIEKQDSPDAMIRQYVNLLTTDAFDGASAGVVLYRSTIALCKLKESFA